MMDILYSLDSPELRHCSCSHFGSWPWHWLSAGKDNMLYWGLWDFAN